MADDRRPRPLLASALSLPAAAAVALGFLLPVFWLARMSLNPSDPSGALGEGWTLHHYAELATDSFYAELTLASIRMAATTTFLALLIGYPIALFLHRLESRWKTLLVLLAISPLLVSGVVRAYGWIVILGDAGWINSMLRGAGLIDRPIRLVNNHVGVTIGLTESLLPYMTLSLLAGLGRLDRGLEEAARTLGASPLRTFLRVTLPLSLPAVVLGSTICFMLAVSAFVTPRLLGGGRVLLLATEIYEQALVTLNWPLAAAIAVAMLALFSLVLFGSGRLQRRVAE
jgi:putative spermidine/putrescine transport system permease protein